MASPVRLDVARLVIGERWVALATLDGGRPLADAPEPRLQGVTDILRAPEPIVPLALTGVQR